jgi:alpha-L-fucosidase
MPPKNNQYIETSSTELNNNPTTTTLCFIVLLLAAFFRCGVSFAKVLPTAPAPAANQTMDKMWGESVGQMGTQKSDRAALFRDGKYGMFIHWGLFSSLGGQWHDQTFYGIGEWIKRQMNISEADYMALAKNFNPADFDARGIARLAKESGMKWIIITAKHHEGFAMFKSAYPFNVVDATQFHRDPMKELAAACREYGLGFGFYYSHNQDWTAPGGTGGPKTNADGSVATFEQYFREKCFPQVKEICTKYGPLNFIWFDTPGDMPENLVKELADYVRQAQPGALLCSRIGYGMGDYASKGDMEVPPRNAEGLWESCDTSNDSWSYAWYDQNWKDSREILLRVVSTVARGGTYLYNIGPDGHGRVPAAAAKYLLKAGEWIKRYPQVVYAAGASPWGHALPWGDVTTQNNTLNLTVFDWPQDGRLFLPGLQAKIKSAGVVIAGKLVPVRWVSNGTWTELLVPPAPADHPASVIQVTLSDAPVADQTLGIYPNITSTLLAEFADVTKAEKKELKWMEKFGEWKHLTQAGNWEDGGRAVWTVDVATPGDYQVELTYKGEGRLVWRIETDEGVKLQNQQNSASVYHTYPFGLLSFAKAGKHTLTVSLIAGDRTKGSLLALRISPME